MAKSKKKKRGKLFVVVLLVVLVLLLWQVWLNKDFSETTGSSFEVTCDGRKVESGEMLQLNVGTRYNFAVKDETVAGGKRYTVQLVACKDVAVTIDGINVKLSNLEDLTMDFVSNVTADGFTLCQTRSFEQLLSDKLGRKQVVVPSGNLFNLVVKSADGSVVIKIPLYIKGGGTVESIQLDTTSIVF